MVHGTFYRILHITRLQRNKTKITTNCKQCSVLSYRVSGSSVFQYDQQKLNVTPQDVLYIPKGAKYSQYTDGEEIICIHFEALGPSPARLQVLHFEENARIAAMFEKIYQLWVSREPCYLYRCMAVFYELMADTAALMAEPQQQEVVQKAVEYLKTRCLETDFRMAELYAHCYISRSGLNKRFKAKLGKTPVEYVTELRIRTAQFLLQEEDYTTAEIAAMCGFKDVKYFYTVFHRLTGCTVKEYRAAEVSKKSFSDG